MANSQIVIKISSSESGSGNGNVATPTTSTPQTTTPKANKAGEQDSWKSVANTIILDQGRRILTDSVNQFLDLTGNSSIKSQASSLTTLIGYGAMLWKGGIVGAIGVAVDASMKAIQSSIEVRKANASIELLRQRVGSSNIDGSRGTYD